VRRLVHDPAHLGDRIHVDARAGRADVHRRADALGGRQGFRNRGDQRAVAGRRALVHERGEPPDEVHADLGRGAVELLGEADVAFRAGALGDQRYRRDGDALVDDGNAVLALALVAGRDEAAGETADLLVRLAAGGVEIGVRAVAQGYAHRDGADVEILHLHHADGLD